MNIQQSGRDSVGGDINHGPEWRPPLKPVIWLLALVLVVTVLSMELITWDQLAELIDAFTP